MKNKEIGWAKTNSKIEVCLQRERGDCVKTKNPSITEGSTHQRLTYLLTQTSRYVWLD